MVFSAISVGLLHQSRVKTAFSACSGFWGRYLSSTKSYVANRDLVSFFFVCFVILFWWSLFCLLWFFLGYK